MLTKKHNIIMYTKPLKRYTRIHFRWTRDGENVRT